MSSGWPNRRDEMPRYELPVEQITRVTVLDPYFYA